MTILNIRLDPRTDEALAQLTADGTSRSDAVRQAILDAAKAVRRQQLRDESERLAHDPKDLAEMRRIQADMEAIRAW
jgi:hypothetical protein